MKERWWKSKGKVLAITGHVIEVHHQMESNSHIFPKGWLEENGVKEGQYSEKLTENQEFCSLKTEKPPGA